VLRALNFILCVAMLGIAAAHIRRPDWWFWVGCFVVPAFWAFIAGFRHRAFRSVRWLGWLWGCLAAWGVLLWRHWPQAPGFWRQQVWLHDADARSGLGLMAALVVLAVALVTAYRKR
jgi:hypothetical protein